jgi:hypothetical protein
VDVDVDLYLTKKRQIGLKLGFKEFG